MVFKRYWGSSSVAMVDAVIEEPQHSEIFLPKNGTVLPPIVARIYNLSLIHI